jgi:prepilin-type N-terminal cleavage/methylation domain-containing protein
MCKNKQAKGFTLVELLVVIAVVSFLITGVVYAIKVAGIKSKDANRMADISTIKKSLAVYLNDVGNYPSSSGECLVPSSGVGAELLSKDVIKAIPTDILWSAVPSNVHSNGYAISPSEKFCYYYYSDDDRSYYLSYFLEMSSEIRVAIPGGEL